MGGRARLASPLNTLEAGTGPMRLQGFGLVSRRLYQRLVSVRATVRPITVALAAS